MSEPLNPLVTSDDTAPAGKPDECFWCKAPVGGAHNPECVRLQKIVRLEVTFTIEVERPHSWDAAMIEAHANESSSCADNLLREVDAYSEWRDKQGLCMCGITKAKVAKPQPETIDVAPTEALLQ